MLRRKDAWAQARCGLSTLTSAACQRPLQLARPLLELLVGSLSIRRCAAAIISGNHRPENARERVTEHAARVIPDYELLRGRYFSDRFSTSAHSASLSFTGPTNLLVNSVCTGGTFLTPI